MNSSGYIQIQNLQASLNSGSNTRFNNNILPGFTLVGGWHLHPVGSVTGFGFSDTDYNYTLRMQSSNPTGYASYMTVAADATGHGVWQTYSLPSTGLPPI